jgi:NAD(P) transhydrogenase subunit alpha
MGVLIVLVGVFLGSMIVGYRLISRVPPLLHTPLMSLTNAVSAITILGALLIFDHRGAAAQGGTSFAVLGGLAIALATFNVLGGFAITDRMLKLFKKR